MVERVKPTKEKPAGPKRPLALADYGEPKARKIFGGCEIYYRGKKTDYGEIRRYYIGLVQFGCIRIESFGGTVHIVHLTGQDDAPGGTNFDTEGEAEAFLFQQLVAK